MAARLRPRFEFVTPCSPEEALGRLRTALAAPGALPGRVFPGHAVVHIPETDQRVWSPFLSLDVGWHPEGSVVRGRFGPKPSIWSLFVAAYAACGFGALFALVFAASQWSLGQPAWALGVLPVVALGALATYGFARYGQLRGHDQMERLRGVVENALA